MTWPRALVLWIPLVGRRLYVAMCARVSSLSNRIRCGAMWSLLALA
jgi:hypothetical protein